MTRLGPTLGAVIGFLAYAALHLDRGRLDAYVRAAGGEAWTDAPTRTFFYFLGWIVAPAIGILLGSFVQAASSPKNWRATGAGAGTSVGFWLGIATFVAVHLSPLLDMGLDLLEQRSGLGSFAAYAVAAVGLIAGGALLGAMLGSVFTLEKPAAPPAKKPATAPRVPKAKDLRFKGGAPGPYLAQLSKELVERHGALRRAVRAGDGFRFWFLYEDGTWRDSTEPKSEFDLGGTEAGAAGARAFLKAAGAEEFVFAVEEDASVAFVRERVEDLGGFPAVYRHYTAPDLATARAFLERQRIDEETCFVVVETAEGDVAKDRLGVVA